QPKTMANEYLRMASSRIARSSTWLNLGVYMSPSVSNCPEMSKATSRVCGWWPGIVLLPSNFRQAQFPACAMWPVIRIAGMHTMPRITATRTVFAMERCMTLFEVNQTLCFQVKVSPVLHMLHKLRRNHVHERIGQRIGKRGPAANQLLEHLVHPMP